jgi:hypothetical protein
MLRGVGGKYRCKEEEVPDARREEATKDLRVTSEADMGCYCAVALVLSDGQLYDTLCCVSHEPDPWLRESDMRLM